MSDSLIAVLAESARTAMLRKGAEEARNQLPELLDAAEKGRSTNPPWPAVAVLVPFGSTAPPSGSRR